MAAIHRQRAGRLAPAALAAVAVLALGGCGGGGGGFSLGPSGPSGATTSRQTSPPLSVVGGTVTLDGAAANQRVTLTLVSFTDTPPLAPGAAPPPAGSRYVAALFRLDGAGSGTYTESDVAACLRLLDTGGRTYAPEGVETTLGAALPPSLSLANGQQTTAVAVFQLPGATAVSKIRYRPDGGHGQETGVWHIVDHPPTGTPGGATSAPASPSLAPSPTASDPASVVQAFYNAINAHDYETAWELGGDNLGSSYSAFVAGFDHTVADSLTIDGVDGDTVTVALIAAEDNGQTQTFTGTYVVSGGVITEGHLTLQD